MPALTRRLEGYPTFAEFISKDKDAAIYRKFENLSARNLLYLQSELHDLERQLEEIDRGDAENIGDENAQRAARLWTHLADDSNAQARARRQLHAEIKVKIREYHEAIILESKVLALNTPSSRTVKNFKKWFKSKSMPVLWGRDEHLFENETDLVALAPVDTDRLNLFLKSYFAWFFKDSSPPNPATPKSELFYFPDRRIQRAGAVISVFLSAILLIGAIVCLTAVSNQSTSVRIGMIVLFTCLFAAVVGLLTNARRAEIFGSTAA
ncbi:MAG: hypothetical protein Q9161_005315 [Pseudevernia consocians]